MKKEYITPLLRTRLFALEHSFMDLSQPVGDDTGDDFNARHRRDEEDFEEVDGRNWGETENSLW